MQVQLSICPETDAEEQIMSMPATEALLESLGLHFSGGDDLSTWLVDGAVHELQDRLVSLLVRFDQCTCTSAIVSTVDAPCGTVVLALQPSHLALGAPPCNGSQRNVGSSPWLWCDLLLASFLQC